MSLTGCTNPCALNYDPEAIVNSGCVFIGGYNGRYYNTINGKCGAVDSSFNGISKDYGFDSNGKLDVLYVNGSAFGANGGWSGQYYSNGIKDYSFNGIGYDYAFTGWTSFKNGKQISIAGTRNGKIYVRATGNDSNDGTIGRPFKTAVRAYNEIINIISASDVGGDYPYNIRNIPIINFGTGNFGGIQVFYDGNNYGLSSAIWSAPLIVEGPGYLNCNFGYITQPYNTFSDAIYLTIISDKSVYISGVASAGGADVFDYPIRQMSVNLINCIAGNINLAGPDGQNIAMGCGFNGSSVYTTFGGRGGDLYLENSQCNTIWIKGGNAATLSYGNCDMPEFPFTCFGGLNGSLTLVGQNQYAQLYTGNGSNFVYIPNGFSTCAEQFGVPAYYVNGQLGQNTFITGACGGSYLLDKGLAVEGAYYDRYFFTNGATPLYDNEFGGVVYDYYHHKYILFDYYYKDDPILVNGYLQDGRVVVEGELLNGGYSNTHYTSGYIDTFTGIDRDILVLSGPDFYKYYHNGLAVLTTGTENTVKNWYFMNTDSDGKWSNLNNWRSIPNLSGVKPASIPWHKKSTYNSNLYIATPDGSAPQLDGSFYIGADTNSNIQISGMCEAKILQEIKNNADFVIKNSFYSIF